MISVITPTGCRPEALALLDGYLQRQTYQDFEWIVVDDCDPASSKPKRANIIQRPSWRWHPGKNTQSINLLVGLEASHHNRIAIMEDDDWYAPGYLAAVSGWLDRDELVGEGCARYFNLNGSYKIHGNTAHASLCSTALRCVDLFYAICERAPHMIDVDLWREFTGTKQIYKTQLCVGIKGMPGRPGIGSGHGLLPQKGDVLKDWIGDDARNYDKWRT